MGKVTEKRKEYARVLTERGVDLGVSYFAHPQSKLDIIKNVCEMFGYRTKSSIGRSDCQAFYYAAQAGWFHLKGQSK